MAKNTEKNEQAVPEPATEQALSGQAAEQIAPEQVAEQTKPELHETGEAPALESLHVLADRYRVPTWRQAALERMMGWAKGKVVSEHEYRAALAALGNRRMGGGRTE